ncbi:hypothetical protein KDL67_07360 [bacterium]|nr:hypothetical protein [bacterium]
MTSKATRTDRLLCCLLLLVLATGCSTPARQPVTTWEGTAAHVLLEYRGEALAVYASGDFNDWTPQRSPFQRMGGDRWELTLNLAPGEYRYLLAVETRDDWSLHLDPANPLRGEDGGGRALSLLRVGNGNSVDD